MLTRRGRFWADCKKASHSCRTAAESQLHVKSEFDDVAILDDVFLPLDPQFAGFACFGKGSQLDQIVEMNRLGGDKSALEIGVDNARGGGRLIARADRPGARLVF